MDRFNPSCDIKNDLEMPGTESGVEGVVGDLVFEGGEAVDVEVPLLEDAVGFGDGVGVGDADGVLGVGVAQLIEAVGPGMVHEYRVLVAAVAEIVVFSTPTPETI